MNKENIRKSCRAEFACPATVEIGDFTLLGRIVNISRGGALIITPLEIFPKEHFRLTFETPEHDAAISVTGTVLRTTRVKSEDGLSAFSSNIKFTEIPSDFLQYLPDDCASEWHINRQGSSAQFRPGSSLPLKPFATFIGTLCVFTLVYAFWPVLSENGQSHSKANGKWLLPSVYEKPSMNLEEGEPSGRGREEQTDTFYGQAKEKPTDSPLLLRTESKLRIQPPIIVDKKTPSGVYHVVQAGENLFRISVNYKTSVEEILRINSLPPGTFIKPGQKLLISRPGVEHLSDRSQENAEM